jgi:hypothetical protein
VNQINTAGGDGAATCRGGWQLGPVKTNQRGRKQDDAVLGGN